jgi:hypothetical protein
LYQSFADGFGADENVSKAGAEKKQPEAKEFSLKLKLKDRKKERSIYGLRIRSHLGGTPGQQSPLYMAGNQLRIVCL